MRPVSCLVWFLLSMFSGVCRPVFAKQEVSLALDCPRLERDPELAAHFEARALVELRMAGAESGRLEVKCTDEGRNASVSWSAEGRETLREWVGFVENDQGWVEQLVAKVWALGEARAKREAALAAPAPPTENPKPTPPPKALPPKKTRSRLDAVVAAPFEFHPKTALLGVRAGLALLMSDTWRSSITAGPVFATASTEPVEVQAWSAVVDGTYSFRRSPLFLRFAAGGLYLNARGDASLQQARAGAFGLSLQPLVGARVESRYIELGLSLGPKFYLIRPVVTVDDRAVVDWAPVAGVVLLDVAVPLARF